jgi:chromosome partitioning protein
VDKVRARANPELDRRRRHHVHDRRTALGKDIKRQIHKVFGPKVFKTLISKSVRLEESPAYKESIFSFAPE